jgi:hypothetical protein
LEEWAKAAPERARGGCDMLETMDDDDCDKLEEEEVEKAA